MIYFFATFHSSLNLAISGEGKKKIIEDEEKKIERLKPM